MKLEAACGIAPSAQKRHGLHGSDARGRLLLCPRMSPAPEQPGPCLEPHQHPGPRAGPGVPGAQSHWILSSFKLVLAVTDTENRSVPSVLYKSCYLWTLSVPPVGFFPLLLNTVLPFSLSLQDGFSSPGATPRAVFSRCVSV